MVFLWGVAVSDERGAARVVWGTPELVDPEISVGLWLLFLMSEVPLQSCTGVPRS